MKNHAIIYLINAFTVALSFLAAVFLRFRADELSFMVKEYFFLLVSMLILGFILDWIYEYDAEIKKRGHFEELVAVLKKQIMFMAVLIICLFLVHLGELFSRLVLGYFGIINLLLTYVAHTVYKETVRKLYKKNTYTPRLIIVSSSDCIEELALEVESNPECEKKLVGVVLLDAEKSSQVSSELGKGVLKSLHIVADSGNIVDYVAHNEVDEVFIADRSGKYTETIRGFMQDLISLGVLVEVNINVYDPAIHSAKALGHMGKFAVVNYSRNIFAHNQVVAKRALDICGGLVGMVLLIVATVFIAPAIKLGSKGPVFFKQTRVGKNGRKFTLYKFRTMYADAEQRKKELITKNESNEYMFKMADDPRVTSVGHFLRRSSLDELPQFYNILKGDMSLVGTRPPTVDEYERYNARHSCRLSMTPGLTGMWQVSGRSDINDFEDVVKLDMEYIDNWSIKKDFKILFQTVGVVFSGKGAR
jgi:exopolysaccharide biosynthesis polyprenyl glycosylphosphotransferase